MGEVCLLQEGTLPYSARKTADLIVGQFEEDELLELPQTVWQMSQPVAAYREFLQLGQLIQVWQLLKLVSVQVQYLSEIRLWFNELSQMPCCRCRYQRRHPNLQLGKGQTTRQQH